MAAPRITLSGRSLCGMLTEKYTLGVGETAMLEFTLDYKHRFEK